MSIGIQPHVIHGPAIDSDRCNSLGRFRGGLAQTFIETSKNRVDRPMER